MYKFGTNTTIQIPLKPSHEWRYQCFEFGCEQFHAYCPWREIHSFRFIIIDEQWTKINKQCCSLNIKYIQLHWIYEPTLFWLISSSENSINIYIIGTKHCTHLSNHPMFQCWHNSSRTPCSHKARGLDNEWLFDQNKMKKNLNTMELQIVDDLFKCCIEHQTD